MILSCQSTGKNMTKSNNKMWSLTLLTMNGLILLTGCVVEARGSGDDIILTKGKLIMRGGNGKGNLILDTGGHKSGDHGGHHMMPMMPMMGHHFNPFSFYPMGQHQHQHHEPAPVVHVQPVYLEDHSAMHQQHHHQPEHHQEHHQHQEYHHEEPHHYQHHEVEHHEVHHAPEHHEMHHVPEHHEMSHHMPQHIEMHHEPMHYEHEGHQEEVHHGGYASHPMMTAMMMHGSGMQPNYEQLATMQALQNPAMMIQRDVEAQRALEKHNQEQQASQVGSATDAKTTDSSSGQASNKQNSVVDPAKENPFVAMIRPLFKRNNTNNKNKKP